MSLAKVDGAAYGQQLSAKADRLRSKFADFSLPELEIFDSQTENYRMRTEFRIWHEGPDVFYIMFEKPLDDASKPHVRVRVDQFPVGSKLINELMSTLMEEVKQHPTVLKEKLYQVNFHTTVSGQAMVTMIYHKKLDEAWTAAAQKLRKVLGACPSSSQPSVHIVGRSRKQKIELDAGHVIETLNVDGKQLTYKQVEGAFSQPNGGMCEKMLKWAGRVTQGSNDHDMLELYCGNGNFTVALAPNFRKVVATELSKASVAAAEFNLAANDITNVSIGRLSAEDFTAAWHGKLESKRAEALNLKEHDLRTILVDPPRAGCDENTNQLLTEFDNIVYISCNPDTLHANLQRMKESHDIRNFALFDQFPYTEHIECGVYLRRRQSEQQH
ncbi:g1183 [Coccomyxa viridis]|uniref:G1183 protein n=1 Tax=Coccomyxa viridis TaxID=1274662 RepID=A0ABP1FLA0_9CHLO